MRDQGMSTESQECFNCRESWKSTVYPGEVHASHNGSALVFATDY